MATLKLKHPVASGIFKVIYPKTEVYNYQIKDDKVLVQHHIKTDVSIHLDKNDVTFLN
jgi:hypothetical protein